jgi:hypothetical protein
MSAARPDLGEDCIQSFNGSPRIPSAVPPQVNICLQSRNRQTQHKHVNKWHTSQSEFLVSNALMIWLNNTCPFWGKRIHSPIPTQNETSNLCQKSNGAILKNPVGTYSRSLKPNPNFCSWESRNSTSKQPSETNWVVQAVVLETQTSENLPCENKGQPKQLPTHLARTRTGSWMLHITQTVAVHAVVPLLASWFFKLTTSLSCPVFCFAWIRA